MDTTYNLTTDDYIDIGCAVIHALQSIGEEHRMCNNCKHCLYDGNVQSCSAVETGKMSIKQWCDHYDRPTCPHYKEGKPKHFHATIWGYRDDR